MYFTEYRADRLPTITLIGRDETTVPHKNINRVCEDYVFYLVTEGELFFCEDSQEYRLQKGDCFLFDPNKHHFGTVHTNYNLIYIHFRHEDAHGFERTEAEWRAEATERNRRWLISTDIANVPNETILIPKQVRLSAPAFSPVLKAANAALDRAADRSENYHIRCALAVQELFLELYEQFLSLHRKSSAVGLKRLHLINAVTDYLNANYAERIRSQGIEEALSYNFDYLNQLYKSQRGVTVFQALELIRIEKAKDLIKTSALSLEQIAMSVGYDNEAYFSKIFKKRTGIPPSQYRKQV